KSKRVYGWFQALGMKWVAFRPPFLIPDCINEFPLSLCVALCFGESRIGNLGVQFAVPTF
ncbi:MAG: hypothetical protein PUJ13_07710, partial [Bacteroidales bacterium]|nr:hypothetical protein [Bacteroidales bacterium]